MYYKMEVLEKIFLLLFKSINSFLSADRLFLLLAEMFNLDDIRNKNNKDHNKKQPFIPDHPYRMLIIEGSVSGKTNSLPTLVKEQDSENLIDKIYWYVKDLNEPKYQFLIKKHEDLGIKYLNDPKAYIEYSQCLADICNNIND